MTGLVCGGPGTSGELWLAASGEGESGEEEIHLDVLLPNGLLLQLPVLKSASLAEIKELAFRTGAALPMWSLVGEGGPWVLVGVGQTGALEELWDEGRRLCDLSLFAPVLKLVEPAGNLAEARLTAQISETVGRSVAELDEARDEQVVLARRAYLKTAQRAVQERPKEGGKDLYSLRADLIPDPADTASSQLTTLDLCVWLDSAQPSGGQEKLTLRVELAWTPAQLVAQVLGKRSRKLSVEVGLASASLSDDFLLKAVGRQLYLLHSDEPLRRFKYISECLGSGTKPELVLVPRAGVLAALPAWEFTAPSFLKRSSEEAAASARFQPDFNENSASLYEHDGRFRCRVKLATHLDIADVDRIYVKVGIFHGPEQLASRETPLASPTNPRWADVLNFDLAYQDIPRAAQICFALCFVKSRRQKEERWPVAWANLRLMDSSGRLIDDSVSLQLHPFPKDLHGPFNPLGHNGSNPNLDSPRIEMDFERFERPVYFPSRAQIADYVERYIHGYKWRNHPTKRPTPSEEATAGDLEMLETVMKRDPLHDMEEEEKAIVWRLRELATSRPDSLPRLLDACKWSSREEVAEVYVFLPRWPGVSAITGLELLDIRYPDPEVRAFAVRALDERLSDEDLELYLLSLVQVLKYEPFLENELSHFLLRRALASVRIGHLFFWLLKAELDFPAYELRFTLLLDAFCRGAGPYLRSLSRQTAATLRLSQIGQEVKDATSATDEKKTRVLVERLGEFRQVLDDVDCPLDGTRRLGQLSLDDCRVLGSAKRPLWLRWSNQLDPLASRPSPAHYLIFKMGDDLRQDALTLQVLRIMDDLWKRNGLDFHLNPYTSLPMGRDLGMIEVVLNSSTIGDMQAKMGGKGGGLSSTFGVAFLNRWIRQHNPSPEAYEAAVRRFTLSCAGYCVATFVLGIRDRHQDNIMVTEDGAIFHIDFGHFLGHYKRKWGISRERVPFVLTDHFITVIARGSTEGRKSAEFEEFMKLCGRAYMTLRSQARLFISLFTMMLCMGIPELQKLEDISYLRHTLAVAKTDEAALAYFQENFREAYGGSWTTRTDWFFHRIKHATKT